MLLRYLTAKWLVTSILVISIGCSLLLVLPQVQGQSNRLRKLSSGVQVDYFEWARDSRSFVYSVGVPVTRDPFNLGGYWTYYNLDTNTFTEGSFYPFLPQLTPQEETIFARTADTFSYLSPDGRYLVYVGEEVLKGFEERYWQLMIGDRHTQTTYTSEYPLYDPFVKEGQFDVRWSQDSRSFVLVTCVDQFFCFPSVFIYVRGLESGFSGMVFDWEYITFPTVAGTEYRTLQLLDFSDDGRWALLMVGEDYGRRARHLMMYNPMTPQSSFLITDSLGIVPRSFRFATSDGSQILYIDNVGIYRYDWANHTSTLLTTEVNNSIASYPSAFSPDGRWFVFVSGGTIKAGELYLFDLQGLPETLLTPTPTATPTAPPTPTPTPTLPTTFAKLRLTSMCSADPALTRRWRLRNTNTFPLPYTWDVYGTAQRGTGTATNGDTFFETVTVPNSPNTVRIFVNGVQQDVKASGGARCN